MLFSFPSFINKNEQSDSDILYNNIKILIQTSIMEIWYDTTFGTNIRNLIKQGINAITVVEIQNEIENKIYKYFSNDVVIKYLDAYQDKNTINIDLTYYELRTGKYNTVKTEETFINKDVLFF